MPNPPSVYYVTQDGAHGCATQLPDGALEIQQTAFELIRDNPGLIDVRVKGNVVHVTPSLISYKNTATAQIRVAVAHVLPDESRMNHLARSVMVQQGCFDVSTGLNLSADDTLATLAHLNKLANDVLYIQHKHTHDVNNAEDVLEVDRILDLFDQTLQGSL